MTYRDDFNKAEGWSAVDVSVRLNTVGGRRFLAFLRENGVDTVIRYYASSNRPKTLTPEEARVISAEGFGILPVFQDSSRDISHFSSTIGAKNAVSAMDFAKAVGQPKGVGSTILFAVDADYTATQVDGPILDHFKAIRRKVDGAFAIGAYGSGAVLAKLEAEGLIDLPWISMSRAFLGTEAYFYGNRWALRQVPPEAVHGPTGTGYDRNVVRVPRETLGAFQVDADGVGSRVGDEAEDATLGGGVPLASAPTEAVGDLLVSTEGLRFRDAPNGTILRDLTIADRVTDLGESADAAWRRIEVDGKKGVAAVRYLRAPGRPEVERLVRLAVDEWIRFEKGQASEKSDPYYRYVRDMWAALGEPYDGRSKYPDGKDVPWSAAFMSWIVRRAGPAYANFQFATSHSVFVNNAIKARVTNRLDKPFWGYRITERKPAVGDIIQRNRDGNSYGFSFAENHSQYVSHSDFVVEVTPDTVRVLGGNIGNSVSFGTPGQEYDLDEQGFLRPGQKLIALLKNRAGLDGPV